MPSTPWSTVPSLDPAPPIDIELLGMSALLTFFLFVLVSAVIIGWRGARAVEQSRSAKPVLEPMPTSVEELRSQPTVIRAAPGTRSPARTVASRAHLVAAGEPERTPQPQRPVFRPKPAMAPADVAPPVPSLAALAISVDLDDVPTDVNDALATAGPCSRSRQAARARTLEPA